jgi:ACS family hexuronate transporter-like MFS transporter
MKNETTEKMTRYRWVVCSMLFVALVVNYLDRQVLSLTWRDFIAPEFHWDEASYGLITGVFSLVYAAAMLFAGKWVDYVGTKRGYLWAIGVWSTGACLHAFCGILTCGIVSGEWLGTFTGARAHLLALQQSGLLDGAQAASGVTLAITSVSVWLFLAARCVLSVGEAGNFPCSIKSVAEYFPKKDRGFATGIFNSGAQIGALIAPFTIPLIARNYGWEMAFLIIGALGYLWMGLWVFVYKTPRQNPRVNAAELAYIEQDEKEEAEDKNVLSADKNVQIIEEKNDKIAEEKTVKTAEEKADNSEADSSRSDRSRSDRSKKIGLLQAFTFRQTWAVIFGRFLPDSVWWFLLFWAPAFISEVYGYPSDSPQAMFGVFTIYLISILSLFGSYLPTYFIGRNRLNPYAGRMKAMLLFALVPLTGIFVMPLGRLSMWYPVVIIGLMCAAHQSWSANVYNVVSDMFPKEVVATVTGAAGLASGLGSFSSNYGAGQLFKYAADTQLQFLGFEGKDAGYMIVFLIAGCAYLFSWCMMKLLVPKYKLVKL